MAAVLAGLGNVYGAKGLLPDGRRAGKALADRRAKRERRPANGADVR